MGKHYPTTEVSRLEIELEKAGKLLNKDKARAARFQSKVKHRAEVIELLKKQLAEAESYAKALEVSIGGQHAVV